MAPHPHRKPYRKRRHGQRRLPTIQREKKEKEIAPRRVALISPDEKEEGKMADTCLSPRIEKSGEDGISLRIIPGLSDGVPEAERRKQQAYGAQSKRGESVTSFLGYKFSKHQFQFNLIKQSNRKAHFQKCIDTMIENEQKFAGEYCVFYHSYNSSWLLYEIHAALANVLYGFKEAHPLPRLLLGNYDSVPNAHTLKFNHQTVWGNTDHAPMFRATAICATSNLLRRDTEATPMQVFMNGYHVGTIHGFLDRLLKAANIYECKQKIVNLCVEYGLSRCFSNNGIFVKNTQSFGRNKRGLRQSKEKLKHLTPEQKEEMKEKEKKCPISSGCPRNGNSYSMGRMLQIFIRRDIAEDFVYCSHAMGVPDKSRPSLRAFVSAGNTPIVGQVRICTNPRVFMRTEHVKIFPFAADPNIHRYRKEIQQKLQEIIREKLSSNKERDLARKGLESSRRKGAKLLSADYMKRAPPASIQPKYKPHKTVKLIWTPERVLWIVCKLSVLGWVLWKLGLFSAIWTNPTGILGYVYYDLPGKVMGLPVGLFHDIVSLAWTLLCWFRDVIWRLLLIPWDLYSCSVTAFSTTVKIVQKTVSVVAWTGEATLAAGRYLYGLI